MRGIAHPDAADFDPITKHRTGPPGVYLPDQRDYCWLDNVETLW